MLPSLHSFLSCLDLDLCYSLLNEICCVLLLESYVLKLLYYLVWLLALFSVITTSLNKILCLLRLCVFTNPKNVKKIFSLIKRTQLSKGKAPFQKHIQLASC